MWQRVGTKLAILIILLGVSLPLSAFGYIKPKNNANAVDEKNLKYESGNMVTTTNGIWLPFLTDLEFDTKPCTPNPTDPLHPDPLCKGSIYEGYLDYGLYHQDTGRIWGPGPNYPPGDPPNGFTSSRFWRLCSCDRNQDGKFDNLDLSNPALVFPSPDLSDTDWRWAYKPESTWLPPNVRFEIVSQNVPTDCTTGNCLKEIVTTMYISLDADGPNGDGINPNLPPVPVPTSGLCFYAEGKKPRETFASWTGNVQARVSTLSGEKTLNFSFENPTPVIISSFTAYENNGQTIVQWETSSEQKTVGFYLYRLDKVSGKFVQVNEELLPGLKAARGGTYRYVDPDVFRGQTYVYKLSELQVDGTNKVYGPFSVTIGDPEGSPPGYINGYEKREHPIPPEKIARLAAAKASKQKGLAIAEAQTGDAIKILVSRSGLYLLTAQEIGKILATPVGRVTDLIKAGGFSLSCQGQEVAWQAAENNAGLYFYGQGIDSLYTNDNVYWLRSGKGQRMVVIKGSGPSPSSSPQVFVDTAHFEQDLWLTTILVKDPQADYWMWNYVSGDDVLPLKFQTPGASGTGMASLTLRLQGATQFAPNPDHHVQVWVNGHLVGEAFFDGLEAHEMQVAFDSAFLSPTGENTLQVAGIVDSGVSIYTEFCVGSFDVTYERLYQAVSDSLMLRGGENAVVTVSGFSQKQVLVFDISVPMAPKYVTATTVEPAAGSYCLAFTPASPGSKYLVVAPAGISRPAALVADIASSLKQKSNAANYLIIAPGQFKAGAQALASYRSSRGLTCKVVDLQDIYDEFNGGAANPIAIQAFLSYAATQWRVAPRYVVLAGDASIDYKDVLGYSENFVPTMIVSTPDGLFASDGALADIYGHDGIGDLALGRLPVVSNTELEQMVAKIEAYETAPDGPWKKRVLMTADTPDPDAGDFQANSELIAKAVPSDFIVDHVYVSESTIGEARAAMLGGINNGAYLVNYIGHGDWFQLSGDGLLTMDDVPHLVNGDRLPVFAAMTCGVGWFEEYGGDCLAESLVLSPSGGAIAVWSPSGWSYNSEAQILNQGLFQAIFSQEKSLGNVIQSAIDAYPANGGSKPFMQQIYNLLGDPALRLW